MKKIKEKIKAVFEDGVFGGLFEIAYFLWPFILRIGPLLGGLIWITIRKRDIYYDYDYDGWFNDLEMMLFGAFLWRVGPVVWKTYRQENHGESG